MISQQYNHPLSHDAMIQLPQRFLFSVVQLELPCLVAHVCSIRRGQPEMSSTNEMPAYPLELVSAPNNPR